jgi:hypothetical protein
MRALRAHRRLTAWIAALAILTASLAPALSQAVASATGAHWIEICTTQGSRWIQAGEDGSEPTPPLKHVLEHCQFCSPHTPTGLPPATPRAHLPPGLLHETPLAFLSAPRTLHAWVSAQPRAPPLFS